ncbi:hypothetical protein [Umezawaea sp. Da 62-37]|uniref:hypothetical protein n=1 Tax=Umezawaea sp. Da 62-37 TaxID=3075927 RepID=UPI0028F6C3AE|nr:hypothetical protein [Umezawaea sp. Da 62-37]WNV84383.1 hypothetical protein RM788_40470 [Umezawaea sp. Da 62-37]
MDEYISEEGTPAIAKAVLGIMSFAVLLGAIMGNLAVKAGALAASIVIVMGLAMLLLADRRKLIRSAAIKDRLVSRYCGIIFDELNPSFRIITCRQVSIIERNGDTKEKTTLHAKVECDHLYFFRLRFASRWDQPVKQREKVKVEVRGMSASDIPGTSMNVTQFWMPDGRLEVLVHFPAPPKSNSEIRIDIVADWPGKSIPLMRHEVPDDFVFRFEHPVTFAQYKVVLPTSCEAYYEAIGFDEDENGYLLSKTDESDGRTQFVFEIFDMPADKQVGVRLQLKKGAPP